MSADLLRKAAREIRNDFEAFECNGCGVPEPFMVAVADLLEADARLMEQTAFAGADWAAAKSVAVARAYLGEPS